MSFQTWHCWASSIHVEFHGAYIFGEVRSPATKHGWCEMPSRAAVPLPSWMPRVMLWHALDVGSSPVDLWPHGDVFAPKPRRWFQMLLMITAEPWGNDPIWRLHMFLSGLVQPPTSLFLGGQFCGSCCIYYPTQNSSDIHEGLVHLVWDSRSPKTCFKSSWWSRMNPGCGVDRRRLKIVGMFATLIINPSENQHVNGKSPFS